MRKFLYIVIMLMFASVCFAETYLYKKIDAKGKVCGLRSSSCEQPVSDRLVKIDEKEFLEIKAQNEKEKPAKQKSEIDLLKERVKKLEEK